MLGSLLRRKQPPGLLSRHPWLESLLNEYLVAEGPLQEHLPSRREKLAGISRPLRHMLREYDADAGLCWKTLDKNVRENAGVLIIQKPGTIEPGSDYIQSLSQATGISELESQRRWLLEHGTLLYLTVWTSDHQRELDYEYGLWAKNDIATLMAGWLNWKKSYSFD
ncbi:hypothetical protein [Desulfurispira natronophila]|uniref:Uncharacterized protein n=1 Tax=Desulfurispira natronophila TaxID=682562 RepID=A0A7W8DG70_9BACT|nr:hypothetical protein [Desulfurispira natronophila]MBB5021122.1 hypothetical protein [Desulfurispira natronophila]